MCFFPAEIPAISIFQKHLVQPRQLPGQDRLSRWVGLNLAYLESFIFVVIFFILLLYQLPNAHVESLRSVVVTRQHIYPSYSQKKPKHFFQRKQKIKGTKRGVDAGDDVFGLP